MRTLWIVLFSFRYKKQINDILSCAAIPARQGDSIMKRITRIIRPIICMAVLLFAMTTAVMGCYQKETGSIDIPGRTPSGTYIERATYELRRERRVRVATSDGPEQVIILGHGALRVSARAFHAEVEAAEGQISAVLQRLTNRPRSERTIRNNVKLKQ